MHSIAAESKKKSTNCANDFWAFYLQNKDRIDKIILAQTHRFKKALDLDDMKQDILLLLIKNNFLGSYDSSQSGIFTYLTNKVRGYAWHLYTLSRPKPWKPSWKSDDVKPWEQVLFHSLNGTTCRIDDAMQGYELPDTKDPLETEYSCQEIVEGIKNKLSPKDQTILDMLLDGITTRDIADSLEVTPQAVVYRTKKIRTAFRNAVRRELVTA